MHIRLSCGVPLAAFLQVFFNSVYSSSMFKHLQFMSSSTNLYQMWRKMTHLLRKMGSLGKLTKKWVYMVSGGKTLRTKTDMMLQVSEKVKKFYYISSRFLCVDETSRFQCSFRYLFSRENTCSTNLKRGETYDLLLFLIPGVLPKHGAQTARAQFVRETFLSSP